MCVYSLKRSEWFSMKTYAWILFIPSNQRKLFVNFNVIDFLVKSVWMTLRFQPITQINAVNKMLNWSFIHVIQWESCSVSSKKMSFPLKAIRFPPKKIHLKLKHSKIVLCHSQYTVPEYPEFIIGKSVRYI